MKTHFSCIRCASPTKFSRNQKSSWGYRVPTISSSQHAGATTLAESLEENLVLSKRVTLSARKEQPISSLLVDHTIVIGDRFDANLLENRAK